MCDNILKNVVELINQLYLLGHNVRVSFDEVSYVCGVTSAGLTNQLNFSSEYFPSILNSELWMEVQDFKDFLGSDAVHFASFKETGEIRYFLREQSAGFDAHFDHKFWSELVFLELTQEGLNFGTVQADHEGELSVYFSEVLWLHFEVQVEQENDILVLLYILRYDLGNLINQV